MLFVYLLLCIFCGKAFANRFTYERGSPEQFYPSECIFLTNTTHTLSELNLTYATEICNLNPNCALGVPFFSTNQTAIVDQLTCSDDNAVYACDTYIPLAKSKAVSFAQPLYRTLNRAGFRETEFWTQTDLDGTYLSCAVGDTRTNVYLFDVKRTDCSASLPFMCTCVAPNLVYDDLIVISTDSQVRGLISLADHTVRIAIPGWYIVTNGSDTRAEFFGRGHILYFHNASFSVERVQDPFEEEVFIKLVETMDDFQVSLLFGSMSFHQTTKLDSFQVNISVPDPGLYEVIAVFDNPANTTISGCPRCSETFCPCMVTINGTATVSVDDYVESPFLQSTISARLLTKS